jgi:tRNA(adenine34) deaminase
MDAADTAVESTEGYVGDEDWRWMERCAALGREAAASGEAAVGSVVTTGNGTWVADGRESVRTSKDVTGHAEVEAIRAACRVRGTLDLSGCILYTTAEPCILCSYAIRETAVARVVIGAWVEDIGGVTSRHPILTDTEMPGWGPPPAIAYAPYPRS